MGQRLENQQLVEGIIREWIAMSVAQPEITSDVWLRAIGLMGGLTLHLSGVSEDQAEGAMMIVSQMAMEAYRKAPEAELRATVQ
jgi:hypothetical protein